MASKHQHTEELRDITECSICHDTFTDPRVLPCIHTFCLKCIKGWSDSMKPDEKLSCPVCRKEVSSNIVMQLPKNYFVQKLLDLNRMTSESGNRNTKCDGCLKIKNSDDKSAVETAINYCMECRHNLCTNCSNYHKIFPQMAAHTLAELGTEISVDSFLLMFPASNCEKHSSEVIKLYCFDCKQLRRKKNSCASGCIAQKK